jgi:hypothetical protein
MTPLKSSRRKMLAAREDLVDKISEIARKRGTLYDYVNEVLQEAIRADSLGASLREIIDERGVVKDAKDSGFILVPARLWYDLIDRAYSHLGEDWMRALWYECGQWYGKYYEDLDRFSAAIKRLLWDLSEFDLSAEGEYLVVKCIILNPSYSHADLLSKFIEGALDIFGYEPLSEDISKGVVNLRFRRRVSG